MQRLAVNTHEALDELTRLAGRIEDLLRSTPGARDIRNAIGDRRTDIALRVDPVVTDASACSE